MFTAINKAMMALLIALLLAYVVRSEVRPVIAHIQAALTQLEGDE